MQTSRNFPGETFGLWGLPRELRLGPHRSIPPINPVRPLGQFTGYCLFEDLLPAHSYRMTHAAACQDRHVVWEGEAVSAHFNGQVTVE